MQAYVYKSLRKDETFVYLRTRDDFDLLPDPIRESVGELRFILEVALTPERRLARANVDEVRAHLAGAGYHLQRPPPPSVSTDD